jgi:hypothetical protein
MKMGRFQNQLRETRKASKKSDNKKGKKPPSIEINYRGLGNNNITTLNDSCHSKGLLKKYLNPNKVVKNKSSSLIKRFAIEISKSKKKCEQKKSKNARKPDMMNNIDTTFLIKSILSNETTISPKSPHNSNFKNSLNLSIKKRKNSNVGTNFNLTGNIPKKRRGKIMLNKSSKSKDKLYRNVDMYMFNKKKSTSRPRDKSNKSSHNNRRKFGTF